MTTVGELFHSLNRDEVIATIDRIYPNPKVDYPSYEAAWDIILRKESATQTTMVCELYTAQSCDDPPETYIGVHGREPGEDVAYAIEFVPWAEWLSMEIRVLPECGEVPPVEVLAHIFWEMTWVGYDDQSIADEKEAIEDKVEEVKAMLGET